MEQTQKRLRIREWKGSLKPDRQDAELEEDRKTLGQRP